MGNGKYAKWISPEGTEQIRAWAGAGLSDTEIAHNIGVSRKTLYEWIKKYPELDAAMKNGEGKANQIVENALFKKCMGYTVTIQKTIKVKVIKFDKQGKRIAEREELRQVPEEVHIPADTAAQRFWLRNRSRERWPDKYDMGDMAAEGIESFLKAAEAAKAK